MPTTEMIAMIAVVSALALGFIHLLRLVGTLVMHRTIRKAAEKDPTALQPLIAAMISPRDPDGGDSRLSTILVALGIATIVASVIINDPRWMHYALAAAVFPLIVGTALWLRLFLIERARRRGSAE